MEARAGSTSSDARREQRVGVRAVLPTDCPHEWPPHLHYRVHLGELDRGRRRVQCPAAVSCSRLHGEAWLHVRIVHSGASAAPQSALEGACHQPQPGTQTAPIPLPAHASSQPGAWERCWRRVHGASRSPQPTHDQNFKNATARAWVEPIGGVLKGDHLPRVHGMYV